ncbi:arsenate reductase family protein [Brevibacillus brevis]|uniref:arsenate reductase family protein n=1 Tax=Brevibacillus brevis TaxID=1393 RepID=UPI001C8DC5C6|nr:arsenate reductase family protein [Brevibacillus brevis]MBY0086129.1 arsenate reductase family protein [Brevibacillus brevis]UKL00267.1 arsenate reductase family protein [Brevibacillus brevis]
MTMKAYLYNKCDTCRKVKKWLTDQNIGFEEIPIVDAPPSKEELRQIWQTSGLDLRKFFNVSGVQYRELGLKDKLPTMSEDEMLELLASNGKLIKRPLIASDRTVTLGFKEEELEKAWGGKA